jgi:hypothetical protein
MTLKSLRQHLRVTRGGDTFDVWTWPIDHDVQAFTWRRHPDWPSREDNPVGFLLFLAWAAARRAGDIPPDLKYETFKGEVEDIEELEAPAVDPTEPVPGAGSSSSSP